MFFSLSRFSLNAIDSHGTRHLTVGLVGKHLAAAFNVSGNKVFIVVIRNSSFKCILKSIRLVFYRLSLLIAWVTIDK